MPRPTPHPLSFHEQLMAGFDDPPWRLPSTSRDSPDSPDSPKPATWRPGRKPLPAWLRHEVWRGIRVQLLIEIKRTARLIDAALDELGEPAMLPERDRRALEYIERCSFTPSISDVARALRISRQAAQRIILRLAKRRFVLMLRGCNPQLVSLRITKSGHDAIRLMGGRVVSLLHSMTVGLDNVILEDLAAKLRGIQDRIRHPRDDD